MLRFTVPLWWFSNTCCFTYW